MLKSEILFKRGVDLDGCNCFRIPFGAVTKNGVWIAGGDLRYTSANDHTGIDIGIRRSLDGGETWLEPQIVFERDNLTDGSRKMDGCIVADQVTGKVFIFCICWGAGNSVVDHEIGYDFAWKESSDDGATWSEERSLRHLISSEEERIFQAPGSGIQMGDGTLVIPCQRWIRGQWGLTSDTRSSILYSKDHGATWEMANLVPHFTTECSVVEIEPGTLMLICRNEDRDEAKLGKKVYVTTDLGQTWVEHETSNKIRQYNRCMGSVLKFTDKTGEAHIIFTGPNNYSEQNTYGRSQITLQKLNQSQTDWELITRIHMPPSQGYSCLAYDEVRGKLLVVLEPTEQIMGAGGDPAKDADWNEPHSFTDIGVRDLTDLIPMLKKASDTNKNIGTDFASLGEGVTTESGKEPRVCELEGAYWIRGTFVKEEGAEVDTVLGILPEWVPALEGTIVPAMAWDGTLFKAVYCEIVGREVLLKVGCTAGKMVLHIPETRIGVFRPIE
ncbi:MAG: sialidase family protein [Cellulosilyticaceae bacterium]